MSEKNRFTPDLSQWDRNALARANGVSQAEYDLLMDGPVFRRLAEVVVGLEDAGCGCDCGKFMHGMSGDSHGGCSYCEAVAAVKDALAGE